MLYWIYIKKDTFFKYKLSDYKRNLEIYKEIVVVSLPSATEEIIFSLVAIILNFLIITTSGVNEVAAFTIAWRIIAIAFLPGVSIGIATITVSGIAYGARNWVNFNETIKYATLLCLAITFLISGCFFIFAYPICGLFSFQAGDPILVNRAAEILRLLVFYNFLIAFGVIAAYAYQGVGAGFKSLTITFLREIVLSMGFAYLFGITFNMGIFGVYLGTIVGMNIGSIIGFICIMIFNRKFKKEVMGESNSM
jgi:Na+-driven multidrug efflux pump